ncbi:MAG: UDP-N-acetylmuramoyl-L-alanyl-D-glutamate--2,6-diaminopimelate ligase, partial [bacterium]
MKMVERNRTKNLLDLAQTVPGARAIGGDGTKVSGLAYDSRSVVQGDLFVAIPGLEVDGHDYAASAVSSGAAAIVIEHAVGGVLPEVPRLVVPSCREAMALLADAFYGHPSGSLSLVGVTGTNGKTTTAFLIDAILRTAGRTTGLMGTIHYRVGERIIEAPRTTSEAPDVQSYLREMLDAEASHAVMEVSSHALDLHRVLGCDFSVAVFTNLTQDHLDFHGDMESYFRAKRRFFTELSPEVSVLNFDDDYGKRIAEEAEGDVWTYGLTGGAKVQADNLSVSAEGMSFDFLYPDGSVRMETSLTGGHNASNILAASATCLALGLSLEEIAGGVRALENVPGRFEKVDLGQPFLVVVDYAHTEDALASVLRFARPVTKGRLLTLMGCGGDRDRK